MAKKICILIILAVPLISWSCKTLENKGVIGANLPQKTIISREEEDMEKKVREWEEYMRFEDDANFSIYALLKLTEDYLGAKESLHKKKMEEYESNMDLYNKGQTKSLPQPPKQDYASFISRFKKLKERFRYEKGGDAVYYVLGYVLSEEGELNEASKIFEELTKDYPESEYALEVNFRLGEMYFDTGQIGEAAEAYGRILKFPNSVFFEKALYKLGWIYFKLEDLRKAVDTFATILDKKWGEEAESRLAEEASSCIVLLISRSGNIDQAIDYFESRGVKVYTPIILERLANVFAEQMKYESAIKVLAHVIEAFPQAPSRPFTMEKLADIYDQIGNERKAVDLRWELINIHNPGTDWYARYCTGDCGKVDRLISTTVMDVSKKIHMKGKKGEDGYDIRNAIKGYQLFLSFYPKAPEENEVNVLLAEAFFDAKMYPEAIKEYEKVAQLFPQGADRGEIAYSMLLAYEILLLNEKDIRTVDSAKEVLDKYEGDLRECGKLNSSVYKLSDMCAEVGMYDRARGSLAPLMNGDDAVAANYKIAELFIKENKLSAAEEIISKLLDKHTSPEVKEELAEIRYKMAEERLNSKKTKDAMAMFSKVLDTFPGSRVGEAALIRMGQIHIKDRDIKGLKNVSDRLFKIYPASSGAVGLLVEGGKKIEKYDPDGAVYLYESAASISRDSNDSNKLIIAAAKLAEANGDCKKAEGLFLKYLEAPHSYEEEAEAGLGLAHCQIAQGKREEGYRNLNKVMSLDGIAVENLAKARLILASDNQETYMAVKIVQPFEETLKEKTSLLEASLKDYSQIAKYAIPELQPEVFFRMGRILENYRDSILQAEKPKDMSKQESEEYNFLLEERAYPYEEQAVKAYEKSVQSGRKSGVFDEWFNKSLGRLAELKPAIYKRDKSGNAMETVIIDPAPASFGGGL